MLFWLLGEYYCPLVVTFFPATVERLSRRSIIFLMNSVFFLFFFILVVGINSSGANPFSTLVYQLFLIQ